MNSCVKTFILSTTFYCINLHADLPLGIIGGEANGAASAYLISMDGTLLPLGPLPASGVIAGVSMNSSGMGIIGGADFAGSGVAYFVSPSGQLTLLSLPLSVAEINSVSINDSGMALIGGYSSTGTYAAFVSPSGGISPISPLPTGGEIYRVSINESGDGLIGATDGSGAPDAYFVTNGSPPSGIVPLAASGEILSVSINSQGNGLLGGAELAGLTPALAYRVSPGAPAIPLAPIPSNGFIQDVAINDSGMGIIGGRDYNTGFAVAYLVSPTGQLQLLPLSSITGAVDAVDINSLGAIILGGRDLAGPAFAYLVLPTGELISILGLPSNGVIDAVAINEFGAGIIGGTDLTSSVATAYLVSPTGALTSLGPLSNGITHSVALLMLSQIPTSGLSGNNLTLANYLNKYAPSTIFYLFPSILDETLSQTLELIAPTRNAFSLFTADNNLFYLDTVFSNHSRDSRAFRRQRVKEISKPVAVAEIPTDQLFASNKKMMKTTDKNDRPFQIWGSLLGALAYQKAQHQTPAFQPTTGGAIIAFDAKATSHGWLGGGAAYTFTHIHEKKDAGWSNINQEYLFGYALWDNTRLYWDAAIWAGLFQTSNVRKMQMTGFNFKSKGHLKGWQLSPHFELGYDFNSQTNMMTFEPFIMIDWVNNWQNRYKESGSGPFNFAQKRHYSSFLRSELGTRFYQTVGFADWRLVFQEKVGYVNKKPFEVGSVNAFLVGAPGSFTVETLTTIQNLGVAEFQMLFEPNNPRHPYGTINYQGEFGSMYQSHLISLNICWNF